MDKLMDKTITIGARYLREGIKRDYNDWRFAWIREVGQNSIDAGATEVYCTVVEQDGNTVIVWRDNGCGMSADIIENKFMALGESGKENGGVGGFGVAGALIAFAQLNYRIQTGDLVVRGAGSSYGIEKIQGGVFIEGTILTVTMEGKEADKIEHAFRKWTRFTTTKTAFFFDGEKVETLKMHKPKAETEWCKVTTYRNIPQFEHNIWVRINGQLVHTRYTSFNIHVVVDLTGESLNYLTSNRDGLKWVFRGKLEKLIQELYQNPNKINATEGYTTIWRGTEGLVRLAADRPRKVSKMSLAAPILSRPSSPVAALAMVSAKQQVKPIFEAKTIAEIQTLIDGHDVVIVNQTNKSVPRKWLPGTMNKHAYRLLNRWIRVVQICGQLLGREENVSIGWVFSHEARALHKYTSEHGHMILLNPVKVGDTRFTNYWDNSNASFYTLVATATHELCHIDCNAHNDAFAAAITYGLGRVMARPSLLMKVKTQTKL